mgnify:CR=1 FL=1
MTIAKSTLLFGFFKPRGFIPFDATPNHLSYYTTDKLKDTLAEFVDLKLLNNPKNMKVSVGAVNVRTGNYTVFSNENMELTFDHIIASGALPPGFPAVEIDGDYYWDGGLVSNTPLDDLIENPQSINQLIFQVDLWDARGQVPENLIGIDERIKDIQYSSKTRYATTQDQTLGEYGVVVLGAKYGGKEYAWQVSFDKDMDWQATNSHVRTL